MGVPIPVICCLIAGVVIVLIFCGAFFVELLVPDKQRTREVVEERKEEDFDIEEMLSKLEQKTQMKEEKKVEQKVVEPIISKTALMEKAEETKEPEVAPVKENVDDFDFDALFKQLEQEAKNSVKEEKVVEPVVEKTVEAPVVQEIKPVQEEVKVIKEIIEPVITGPDFDYNVRIETIKQSQVKLEKDLQKATRDVNKYEKTIKRKERNEKLLDRKSAELTNLNLVLYNVNNIDDIDPEKKKKQEDLIEHITELKNSIHTAKQYIEDNKEKYTNSKKIQNFLLGEKVRYEEELLELEQLIAAKKNKK